LAKKLAVADEDFLEELETDIEDEVELELKGWLDLKVCRRAT
jgi:hypothetical protein